MAKDTSITPTTPEQAVEVPAVTPIDVKIAQAYVEAQRICAEFDITDQKNPVFVAVFTRLIA